MTIPLWVIKKSKNQIETNIFSSVGTFFLNWLNLIFKHQKLYTLEFMYGYIFYTYVYYRYYVMIVNAIVCIEFKTNGKCY